MADLIIKPEATSGNKLILKDQAGGAVLTTADSGATIANATLNSPTLVTPALGTPASGVVTNLSGVLPVGVTGGSGLNAVDTNITVVNTNLTNSYSTSSGALHVGTIAIPSAGQWRLEAFYRLRWSSGARYIRAGISSNASNNETGMLANWRMIAERINVTTFGNLGTDAVWLMDFPTGASFPYSVHTKILVSGADSYFGNVNDSNGVPTFVAIKYKNTTNTDSTIRQI